MLHWSRPTFFVWKLWDIRSSKRAANMNCCFFFGWEQRVTFANFLHLFIQGPPLTHSALHWSIMIIEHQIILEIEYSILCFNKCCALCIVKCCLSSEGILQHASQLHLRYSTICLRNHKDNLFADVKFTWISFFPLFSWFFCDF